MPFDIAVQHEDDELFRFSGDVIPRIGESVWYDRRGYRVVDVGHTIHMGKWNKLVVVSLFVEPEDLERSERDASDG